MELLKAEASMVTPSCFCRKRAGCCTEIEFGITVVGVYLLDYYGGGGGGGGESWMSVFYHLVR